MAGSKFSIDDDNLLIDLIKVNPTLYNQECETYKDLGIRENAWMNIAAQLNKSDEDCKKHWKHIRDSYNRYKRKRKNGRLSWRSKNSNWEMYEKMSFLEKLPTSEMDNINPDSESSYILSSFPNDPTPLPLELQMTSLDQDDDVEGQAGEASRPGLHQMPGGETMRGDDFAEILNKREERMYALIQNMCKEKAGEMKDDVSTFGEHVKCILKKLSPRLRVGAKNEIFSILSKYETLQMDI